MPEERIESMELMLRELMQMNRAQNEEIQKLRDVTHKLLQNSFSLKEKETLQNRIGVVYDITQPKAKMSPKREERIKNLELGILLKQSRKAKKRS